MAETIHVIIVVSTFIYLVLFAAFTYWLISTRRWDFENYVQNDPTDTNQFYRVGGTITMKPTIGTPCTSSDDCKAGVLLDCNVNLGICASVPGGVCSDSNSDCMPPSSCVNNMCVINNRVNGNGVNET